MNENSLLSRYLVRSIFASALIHCAIFGLIMFISHDAVVTEVSRNENEEEEISRKTENENSREPEIRENLTDAKNRENRETKIRENENRAKKIREKNSRENKIRENVVSELPKSIANDLRETEIRENLADAKNRENRETKIRENETRENKIRETNSRETNFRENEIREERPAIYVVRAGDTLTKIAKNFGTTPEELAKINGKSMKKMNLLWVGQKIKLR